jgi:hypothetical protein
LRQFSDAFSPCELHLRWGNGEPGATAARDRQHACPGAGPLTTGTSVKVALTRRPKSHR